MPKPVLLSLILRVLRQKGFFFVRQKGSHARFRKIGNSTKHVTIKMSQKEIPYGTFQSILLQSGLKESEFFDDKKNKIQSRNDKNFLCGCVAFLNLPYF